MTLLWQFRSTTRPDGLDESGDVYALHLRTIEDAPSLAPDDRPIDLVHLARMTLGDRSLEREVLQLFDRQSTLLIARMRAASPEGIALLAHTLKGSARGIGAWRVARAAEAVEAADSASVSARSIVWHLPPTRRAASSPTCCGRTEVRFARNSVPAAQSAGMRPFISIAGPATGSGHAGPWTDVEAAARRINVAGVFGNSSAGAAASRLE